MKNALNLQGGKKELMLTLLSWVNRILLFTLGIEVQVCAYMFVRFTLDNIQGHGVQWILIERALFLN